eukprot:364671-Chlamydomonas_euryale.AAC.4
MPWVSWCDRSMHARCVVACVPGRPIMPGCPPAATPACMPGPVAPACVPGMNQHDWTKCGDGVASQQHMCLVEPSMHA